MILLFCLFCFGFCAYAFGPAALIGYCVLIVLPLFLFLGSKLNDQELEVFLQKEQKRLLQPRFPFHGYPQTPPIDRGGMNPSGQLYEWAEPVASFPATIAANWLKHKKHEWVVIGFGKDGAICKVWANKGDDRSSVSPGISAEETARLAERFGCTDIVSMHNHPNSNSHKYSCKEPSLQDMESANYWANVLTRNNLNFVDIVCECGTAYPYYWASSSRKEYTDEEFELLRSKMTFMDNLEERLRLIFACT